MPEKSFVRYRSNICGQKDTAKMMEETYALELKNITKRFGSFLANRDCSLKIRKGEIHALIGENGAGKSTLMNIVSGIYQQTSGEIFIKGKKVDFHSPHDALGCGVGMIYQHFRLVNNMTVTENIIGGYSKKLWMNRKKEEESIRKLFESTGMDVPLDALVRDLSISQKQIVEIVKVLYRGADLLILDEPTAVLTPQETEKLFDVIRRMKANGQTVIIITHKLNEIMEISDRITVMRAGEVITTVDTREMTIPELTNLIVGKEVHYDITRVPCTAPENDAELLVSNVSYVNSYGVKKLDNISFTLRKGEVFGVAGVGGSGQKPLCEILAGILPVSSGSIIFRGEDALKPHADKAIMDLSKISVGFVPESRLTMGLVGSMDMVDNVNMRFLDDDRSFLYHKNAGRKRTEDLVKELDIKSMGVDYPVKRMSGGNIQKVLLGREMMRKIDLLVVAYPVRGLDTQTTHLIYDLLNQIKEKGIPIVFIGEDLDHIMAFCDRIAVLFQGHFMGIVDNGEMTKDQIGQMMVGNEVSA